MTQAAQDVIVPVATVLGSARSMQGRLETSSGPQNSQVYDQYSKTRSRSMRVFDGKSEHRLGPPRHSRVE